MMRALSFPTYQAVLGSHSRHSQYGMLNCSLAVAVLGVVLSAVLVVVLAIVLSAILVVVLGVVLGTVLIIVLIVHFKFLLI